MSGLPVALALLLFLTGAKPADPMDKRVAVLIEKIVNAKTEQQAFRDLEKLGCAAVPSIIRRMDDRRNLPERYIALKNQSPGAFEAMRQYGPEQVVDALAAILNQITGQHFEFIYNGGTAEQRARSVRGWRDYLKKTPADKLCQ